MGCLASCFHGNPSVFRDNKFCDENNISSRVFSDLMKDFSRFRSTVATKWVYSGSISSGWSDLPSSSERSRALAGLVGIEITAGNVASSKVLFKWGNFLPWRNKMKCDSRDISAGCISFRSSKVFAYTPLDSNGNTTRTGKRPSIVKRIPKELLFVAEQVKLRPKPLFGPAGGSIRGLGRQGGDENSRTATLEASRCYDEKGQSGVRITRLVTSGDHVASFNKTHGATRGLCRWISISPTHRHRNTDLGGVVTEEIYSLFPYYRGLYASLRHIAGYLPIFHRSSTKPCVRMLYVRRGECPPSVALGRVCVTRLEAFGFPESVDLRGISKYQLAHMKKIAPNCSVIDELERSLALSLPESESVSLRAFPPRRSSIIDTMITFAARRLS